MVLFVDKVGVVGAGTMGSQIAEIFALNGKDVTLVDVEEKFVDGGLKRIRKSLDDLARFHESKADREVRAAESKLGIELTDSQKETARGNLKPTYTKERVDEAFNRITGAADRKALAGVDMVVEAIVERLDVKKELFNDLNQIVDSRAVFCTNTSSLPVTEMAASSGRPTRFLATHFFNPPTTLPLVEIVRAESTDDETVQDVMNVLSSMRNHRYPLLPIPVKECPAFLVNRILGAMLEEAYRCYEEKVASPRDIDSAVKAGAGFPMGPLELSDLIGLDVIKHVRDHGAEMAKNYKFVNEPKIVDQLVAEGRLGRKAGRGFFEY